MIHKGDRVLAGHPDDGGLVPKRRSRRPTVNMPVISMSPGQNVSILTIFSRNAEALARRVSAFCRAASYCG